ncbi:Glycoside hydrolase, family 12 [Penicillium griseofulvum]|uniref:xyloglucan-specific endo-beta-1,4-glucanase n=1 Tax=Penicillium patulum TaxID=5078 RepID=A0A135LNC0_PENPA|nr:Glycoside hydrolase, family 12 [Penicillium griseofulvum]KXG50455.1 Glycoside hydrolase, family 12 [Penicillium griseofulvum]
MKSFIAPVSLISLALANMGDAAIVRREAEICDQYGTTKAGDYTIFNNLWNLAKDPNAKQCTGVDSSQGNTVTWHTKFSWGGEAKNEVKSFANAGLNFTPKVLSTVTSIKSAWEWDYSTTDIIADVAYDLFLSSTPDGSEEYEIMVWLAAMGGAGPISTTGQPIATVTIGGSEWDVSVGPNGQMTVYSFVAKSTVKSYSGDLLDFFKYLVKDQGLDNSKYLKTVQAGTEPFIGTADFTTSSYSVSVV